MRQRLVACVAVGALLAGSVCTPPARAQMDSRDAIALQNQILELSHELQVLQAPVAGGELVPQLLSRVQALEEEVRRLRGELDDLQNASQRQYADLTKQIGDLKFRLGQSGAGAHASARTHARPERPRRRRRRAGLRRTPAAGLCAARLRAAGVCASGLRA